MMVITLFLSLVLYIYYVFSLFLEPIGNVKKRKFSENTSNLITFLVLYYLGDEIDV